MKNTRTNCTESTIGNTSVGEKVDIKYNPFKPEEAFIANNLPQKNHHANESSV